MFFIVSLLVLWLILDHNLFIGKDSIFPTVSLCSRHICLLVVVFLVLLLVLFTHFACWHLGQHFFMWNSHVLFRSVGILNSHPLNANSGPSPHNNQKYHHVFQKAVECWYNPWADHGGFFLLSKLLICACDTM